MIKRTPKRLAKWGQIGGKAKVRKGIAVYVESLNEEQRREFYARRAEKRWGKVKGDTPPQVAEIPQDGDS